MAIKINQLAPSTKPATKTTKGEGKKPATKTTKTLPPSIPAKGQWFATIGTKGCALFKGICNSKGEVIPLENCSGRPAEFGPVCKTGEQTVAWKGGSEQSQGGKAARAWTSQAGQKVKIFTLTEALKKGLVVKLQAAVDRGNGEKRETVYVPKGTKVEHKAPQYCGAEVPGGRFETTTLSKLAAGRADNQQFAASVVFLKS